MASYRRLRAWNLCHALALEVYRVTDAFPKSKRYELTSQLRRAGFSAAANIVEGAARSGVAEFRRFLNVSISSLAELEYALMFARDCGLMDQPTWTRLEAMRKHASIVTWKLYASLRRRRSG